MRSLLLVMVVGFVSLVSANEKEGELSAAKRKEFAKKTHALCLESRKSFNDKYTAVKEDYQATCACLRRALEERSDEEVFKSLDELFVARHKSNHSPELLELPPGPSGDYADEVLANCVVDPAWKLDDPPIEDFDEKMAEIERRMTVRVDKKQKDLDKKKKSQ